MTCLLLSTNLLRAQDTQVSRVIRWDRIDQESSPGEKRIKKGDFVRLHFDNAIYRYPDTLLPHYFEIVSSPNIQAGSQIKIENFIFRPAHEYAGLLPEVPENIEETIEVVSSVSYVRKKPVLTYSILPLRKNPVSGQLEKLVYFTYQVVNTNDIFEKSNQNMKVYSESSLLSNGKWAKVRITEDGIYKITYSELVSMGITDPSNPKVFGNGGKMLPMNSALSRPDDLVENAIWIEKGLDGVFNQDDYILFYGKGPGEWNYNAGEQMFLHSRHLYSNAAYYFITSDAGLGKTIISIDQSTEPENVTVTTYDSYQYHERELVNLIKSGRQWFEPVLSYGENFFQFNIPDIKTTDPVKVKSRVLARSDLNSFFTLKADGVTVGSINLSSVNIASSTSDYASVNSAIQTFSANNDDITLSLGFNDNGYSAAVCWLDYLVLNARSQLSMSGTQMHFLDRESVGPGNVASFQLSNVIPAIRVWDITDLYNIKEQETTYESGSLTFKTGADSLRKYIAFDDNSFLTPEIVENPVPNQDLHGLDPVDMIIVSHPDFSDQANQLADLHTNQDNLRVVVVTPGQIYNEFSSGTPDVSAIRDFVKMFYDKAATSADQPRYLLLFGDGSFDNVSDHENNTNFILTYQSLNSFGPTRSYVTDDFFGILDDGEEVISGLVDIGIGRFPVSTVEEAQAMIDKIVQYTDTETRGEWRNMICFIGDDEDNNIHMRDANSLANQVNESNPSFITQKIFLDAYPQVSSPSGESYPDVNAAINDRVNSGALIINYVGHGNERGLAHEGILSVSDILSWDNFNHMPLFITATCEFSRFDDIERSGTGEISKKTSAGEQVLLNPEGGGIGLLTTTRLVYSNPNFILNQNFYDFAFQKDSMQQPYRLGDILRLTKNNSGSSENKRNFTLLGDPALSLAYPQHTIVTDSINGVDIVQAGDTLKALSRVTISGHIEDFSGTELEQFSGILYPVIYDKPVSVTTLGNDNDPPMTFLAQNNILYKGQASINEGRFSFSFIVPKDISYQIDFGKIIYYGNGTSGDANGYFKDVLIGGFSENPLIDVTGPDLFLFINNTQFVSGGITDENPILLALVTDENGINTVGNGIGHDITAILDGDYQNLMVLNDYYESDIDSYQSGKIEYQISNLKKGNHEISVKVWDVLNNSSVASIEFIVTESANFVLEKLMNFPNPFTEQTSFVFEHNQTDGDLVVVIRIFDLSGQIVKVIRETFFAGGYRIGPIQWDGRDDNGNKLGSGIYVYRVSVRSSFGENIEAFEKLVIVK